MNAKNNGNGGPPGTHGPSPNTPRCALIGTPSHDAVLNDFVENTLTPDKRREVAAHLHSCPACAKQVRELSALVRFFHHSVPAREPVLDIWAELSPKVSAWEAEERLGVTAKMRLRSHRFLHNVAAGAILFTQALALNTQARMEKYLLGDSLRFAGSNGANGTQFGFSGKETR